MKNYIYGFLLVFIVLACPSYANDMTSKEPSLQLNEMTYKPYHVVQILHDTLYLSGEDFAALTYGTYEHSDNERTLNIQNNRISYTEASRYITLNGTSKLLNTPTFTMDEITYLPITLLDIISYPYTLSSDGLTLSITPLLPYSTATDTPDSHSYYGTEYKSYEELLGLFLSPSQINELVTDAKKYNRYMSFISTAHKKACFELMTKICKDQVFNNIQTNVHLRQINRSSSTPSVSGLSTLPVTYEMTSDGLSLKVGDTQYQNNIFWATYNPSQTQIAIDLNKSLDILVMRSLYAYYRDLYDLKDDLDTAPITTIQMGRSDQMCYRVYLDTVTKPMEFQVMIYRKTTAKNIDYYIDFIAS